MNNSRKNFAISFKMIFLSHDQDAMSYYEDLPSHMTSVPFDSTRRDHLGKKHLDDKVLSKENEDLTHKLE